MAISLRESPWYVQGLLFFALAVLIFGAGEFLPWSPIRQVRTDLEKAKNDYQVLNQEVVSLQVYDRRYAEFKAEMEALQKQLETLKTIVPEEKELDEFIRLLQGAAAASNVQIRSLAAQPIVARDIHYEMPFELQVDGPYYSILDFFARLSRLSRIINVGDLKFTGVAEAKSLKYPLRPGTSVAGAFTATTFFTKGADEIAARQPGKQPGKR